MSYYTQPFAPGHGAGVLVTPGVASATQALPNNASTVCLTNIGSYRVSVRFGETNAVAASLNGDYTILPGMQVTITKQRDYQFFAHISTNAGASLHVIPGEGF